MFFKILAICHTVIISDHNFKNRGDKKTAGTVKRWMQKLHLRKKSDSEEASEYETDKEKEENEEDGEKEAPKEEMRGDEEEDSGDEEGSSAKGSDIEGGGKKKKAKKGEEDDPHYQAASPDEAALVSAARKLGYAFSVIIPFLFNFFWGGGEWGFFFPYWVMLKFLYLGKINSGYPNYCTWRRRGMGAAERPRIQFGSKANVRHCARS